MEGSLRDGYRASTAGRRLRAPQIPSGTPPNARFMRPEPCVSAPHRGLAATGGTAPGGYIWRRAKSTQCRGGGLSPPWARGELLRRWQTTSSGRTARSVSPDRDVRRYVRDQAPLSRVAEGDSFACRLGPLI